MSSWTGHTGADAIKPSLASATSDSAASNVTGTGGLIHKDGITTPVFRYSSFVGTNLFTGMASVVGTNGNVSLDADFVNGGGEDLFEWDLHLRSTSPLRNIGSPNLLDPEGSPSDMGAYGGPGGDW